MPTARRHRQRTPHYDHRRRVVKLGGEDLTYLIRDEFWTPRAAGAVFGTPAEPGPGTRAGTDTGNNGSIAGGLWTVGAVAGLADPTIYHEVQTRQSGLCAFFIDAQTADRTYYGWGDIGVLPTRAALQIRATVTTIYALAAGIVDVGVVAAATNYQLAIILRSSGSFFLIKEGAFANWTLLWVTDADAIANLYASIASRTDTNQTDALRVAQLAAPWDADYGIATQRLAGARAPGDTFVHEANCHIEMEVDTLPGGGQIELWFRIQDALNYWAVTVNAAGDLELDEVVAGATTQRGVSLACVANSDRVVIIADGTTIRVFEGPIGENLQITYAAAANFQTETDGELDTEGAAGAVSEIISWPRYPSGAALMELNRYTRP